MRKTTTFLSAKLGWECRSDSENHFSPRRCNERDVYCSRFLGIVA